MDKLYFPPEPAVSASEQVLLGGLHYSASFYFLLGQTSVLVALTLVSLLPALKLLYRVGLTRWWAALLLFPIIGLVIIVWIVAFRDWSTQHRQETVA